MVKARALKFRSPEHTHKKVEKRKEKKRKEKKRKERKEKKRKEKKRKENAECVPSSPVIRASKSRRGGYPCSKLTRVGLCYSELDGSG